MRTLDSYPDEVKQKLEHFLQNSDLERMSRTITKLFFAYLRESKEGFSVDFGDILYDVENLLDFLENILSKENTT